jgi:hypothetical protein
MHESSPTICLNMIVKNEIKVLPRLFKSLIKYIDSYIIVDTGSSDGTQEYIKNFMQENKIPGGLYQREWINFGANRQIALELAKDIADYLMIIDADEELIVTDQLFKNALTAPSYTIVREFGSTEYRLPFLIDVRNSNTFNWKWNAPVHNYLTSNENLEQTPLEKNRLFIKSYPHQGAKSHGISTEEKYLKDAELLEQELLKNPKDTRSMFYLAQSYKDAKKYDLSYKYYKMVTLNNGWLEEKFCAHQQLMLHHISQNNIEDAIHHAFKAINININRTPEITFYLMKYYKALKDYPMSLLWAKIGLNYLNIKDFKNYLFINKAIYSWLYNDELSLVYYNLGDTNEFLNCINSIYDVVPEEQKARLDKNKTYA